jgi:hypothetical protein
MPSTASPFGLRVAKGQSGPVTRIPERIIVPAANAASVANIGAGDPVYIDGATGFLRKTAAGTGGQCLGTFQGVEYSDSSGKRTVSNWWSTPAVYAGSEVWFWFSADTSGATIYEAQTNAAVTQADIGRSFGISFAAPFNTVTGFSTAALDTTTSPTAGPFILWNLAFDPIMASSGANNGYAPGTPTAGTNNWGDNFVNVYVKLAQPQYAATVGGF